MSSVEDICQVDKGYILVLPKKKKYMQYANTCNVKSNAEGCDTEKQKQCAVVQPALSVSLILLLQTKLYIV